MCYNEEKELIIYSHCGICLGNGKIIHAWDKIRIDDFKEIEHLQALTGDYPEYIGWVDISRILKQKPSN